MSALGRQVLGLLFVSVVAAGASTYVAGDPYDCDVEYGIREVAWTPDWKAWCCKNKHKGCPSTATSTATTTSETTTSETTTSETTTSETTTTEAPTTTTEEPTTTTERLKGCAAVCEYQGVAASCRGRIQWAATHVDHGDAKEKAPCAAARVLVISQCDVCGDCELEDAQCAAPRASQPMRFRKKFESVPDAPLPSGNSDTQQRLALAGIAGAFAVAVVFGVAVRGSISRRFSRSGGEVYLRAELNDGQTAELS